MISICLSDSTSELTGILSLQQDNLAQNITVDDKATQGFVTVRHSFDDIMKLHTIEPHVIAKESDKVVAYVLAMTQASRNDIPVLVPMFEQFNKVPYKGKLISEYNYIVIGQTCISKDHRGKGLFDLCYQKYADTFSGKYDFAITEISTSNFRSLKAHQRMGFEVIHRFEDEVEEWNIVLWDWKLPTS